MEESFLQVNNLTVSYQSNKEAVVAVNDISFALEAGSCLGIIGESGSGKTTIALTLIGVLSKTAAVKGEIVYRGNNLLTMSEKERNDYRWKKIAIVFQNSLDVFNPVLTIGEQIAECCNRCAELYQTKSIIRAKVCELLELVGLDSGWETYYPHQLSGGIRQRVLLAMALACQPDILLVDEPTNALDAVAKQEIIELLSRLHKKYNFSLILISHEMKTVAKLTTRLAVMYKGRIVEEGFTKDVLNNPLHNYTRGLLNSSPDINPYRDLWGISNEEAIEAEVKEGCPFYARCNQHIALCQQKQPELAYMSLERKVACNRHGIVTLLKATGIRKTYKHQSGKIVKACDECSIEVRAGEIVALLGQSGSGKSTLASILAGSLVPESGTVWFQDKRIKGNSATSCQHGLQLVFQDPYSAVNEQLTVFNAVVEPLQICASGMNKSEQKGKLKEVLQLVQLSIEESFLQRKCYTLSGGQRQRLAVARALVMEPVFLIADEISSMLDPSTQANMLRLLKSLQNRQGFAVLYITHDLAIAQKIADKVYIMHQGKIVEHGNTQNVLIRPTQQYTCKLVAEGKKGLLY